LENSSFDWLNWREQVKVTVLAQNCPEDFESVRTRGGEVAPFKARLSSTASDLLMINPEVAFLECLHDPAETWENLGRCDTIPCKKR